MSDTNETGDQASNERDPRDVEIEKLKSKNKELLAEKQKAKQAEQAARDAADEAETTAAAKNGDIEALKAAHQRELTKLQTKLEAADGKVRIIMVDNAIKDAITQGNVKPEYAKAVTALWKSEVEYDSATGTATLYGQSIGEYATGYLSSNEGAHFVRAADNSGGGAQGSDGSKASSHKPWNATDYGVMRKTDPAGADAWARATQNESIIPKD